MFRFYKMSIKINGNNFSETQNTETVVNERPTNNPWLIL